MFVSDCLLTLFRVSWWWGTHQWILQSCVSAKKSLINSCWHWIQLELHYSPGTRPEHPETWQLSPVTEHSAQQKFLLLESSEEHRPRALKSALHFCRFVTSHDPHFSQI